MFQVFTHAHQPLWQGWVGVEIIQNSRLFREGLFLQNSPWHVAWMKASVLVHSSESRPWANSLCSSLFLACFLGISALFFSFLKHNPIQIVNYQHNNETTVSHTSWMPLHPHPPTPHPFPPIAGFDFTHPLFNTIEKSFINWERSTVIMTQKTMLWDDHSFFLKSDLRITPFQDRRSEL